MEHIQKSRRVPSDLCGQRLDQVAALLFEEFSRSRLQSWIKSGELTVDGAQFKPKAKLYGGETLAIDAQLASVESWQAQAIPLSVIYQDEQILVVNKPAGLVVHPAAGHADGTLLNALLHHCPETAALPRAGLVHRLDKDTSGLMVVAKTLQAHASLVAQLQARTMGREYEAVVAGLMPAEGTVCEAIGRHPVDRKRMAVVPNGKPATTHYRLIHSFRHHSHMRLKLESGRTHQIRVHLSHLRYPIVGDPVYGGRAAAEVNLPALQQCLAEFKRQALHAHTLRLLHPEGNREMEWSAELPDDIQRLLQLLHEDESHTGANAAAGSASAIRTETDDE